MGNFNQLRETCFYKTGRDGVVLEFCDNLHPNIFKDNSYIENSIYDKYSKFKITLVDARKKSGKGNAVYYNLDTEEIILIALLLSDGDSKLFKARNGVYTGLNSQVQIAIRQLLSTFQCLDWNRFDNKIKSHLNAENKHYKDANALMLQKNFNIGNNKLSVRKLSISYEDGMRSSSKWKIAIEEGFGLKDIKGTGGLNIVKSGTYKMENKSYLNLQEQELLIPIYEAAKRVFISQQTFYPIMKQAEKVFTLKKMSAKDYTGQKIDQWNKGALPKEPKEHEKNNNKAQSNTKDQNNSNPTTNIQNTSSSSQSSSQKCSCCGENVSDAEKNYSVKKFNKILCRQCQNKAISNKSSSSENNDQSKQLVQKCSECGSQVSSAEKKYSLKEFNKVLCRKCQSVHRKQVS